MASTSDSILAPSRRVFFGSAVGAGLAATGPAIFTVAGTSALADACDWAVAHSRWINNPANPIEDWPDERLEVEISKVEAVIARAADEPSQGFGDIQAKCRLLLDGYEGRLKDGHDELRLTVKVMREIVAMVGRA